MPVGSRDLVDNAELRAAAERAVASGYTTWARISRDCGLGRQHSGGDTSRVKIALGIRGRIRSSGTYYNTRIDYTLACQIARAIDCDPVDLGL